MYDFPWMDTHCAGPSSEWEGPLEEQKIPPFEVRGTEGEQWNSMAYITPNRQLLGALNPLLRYPLGLSSECTLLYFTQKKNHFCLLFFISSVHLFLASEFYVNLLWRIQEPNSWLPQHRYLIASNTSTTVSSYLLIWVWKGINGRKNIRKLSF